MIINQLFRRNADAIDAEETGPSYWNILSTNLFSFFNWILFAVSAILLIFGRYNDALITLSTGLTSAFINSFQEMRAKRQLDKIAVLVHPTVIIVRNGKEEKIPAQALNTDDLIHLRAGDQAPADGVVDHGMAEMDESLLTGESDLIRKQPGDSIFSGSFCITGDLIYRATAVGRDSFAGKLTTQARQFANVVTPLQQQVSLVIRLLMVLTVILALLFYITGFIRNLTFLQDVKGSAVLVGLIPYGLFLAISLAYTVGAVKLAQAGALVQHTSAVEALHYVDVLCMDKTGTLTANALQVHDIQSIGAVSKATLERWLGDFVHSIGTTNPTNDAIRHAVAGHPRPLADEVRFASIRKWSALAFATYTFADSKADGRDGYKELSIMAVPRQDDGSTQLAEVKTTYLQRAFAYGNTEQHDDKNGPGWGVFVLGALEMLQPYLPAETIEPLAQQAAAWSAQGLRVLLFAHNPNVTTLHDAAGEPALPALQPVGLVSLRDELRPQARETLEEFTRLGVRLKIISGDNPQTVAALAKQAGLVDAQLISGPELAAMSAAEFEQAADDATIFGRISPEQKQQLVDALLKRGRYVAMIGDGVNDILALKKAKVGIAMQSGSNATRNVADMVLLNDSYAALAPALDEGKRIINGLTDATSLLLARSFTYAFVIIGALMAGLAFPFEPAQTAITTLTVGLPSFCLALWARPQTKEEPLFTSLVRFVLPVALWSMIIGVALYTYVYYRSSQFLSSASVPQEVIAMFEQVTGLTYQPGQQFGLTAARISAQTALSVFLSLGALLLILFLEPPVAWLAVWRPLSADHRPTWLALSLMGLFLVGLFIPAVSNYLGFIPLYAPLIWRDILLGLVLWAMGLWLLWRNHWLDRLLALDT